LTSCGSDDPTGYDPATIDIATMVIAYAGTTATVNRNCTTTAVMYVPQASETAITVSFRKADGAVQPAVSDGNWRVAFGPSTGPQMTQSATGDFTATMLATPSLAQTLATYALIHEPSGRTIVGPCNVVVEAD
jgi:hypothetical protein